MRSLVELFDGFSLFSLTKESVTQLWDIWRQFPYTMDEGAYPKTNPPEQNLTAFAFWLSRPDTILVQYQQSGVVGAYNIVRGARANVFVLFWDRKLKGREVACRRIAQWIVRTCDLERLSANICGRNIASIKFASRMGLIEEGVLKHDWPADGVFYDTHIYGAIRDQILAWLVEEPDTALVGQGAVV